MKKLILLAIPALMVSCGPKKFSIEGETLEQLDSTYAYLMNDKEEKLDSCLITQGKFTFTDTVSGQKVYLVHMGGHRTAVFVENGCTIKINAQENPIIATDNGGLNDKSRALTDTVQKLMAVVRAEQEKMFSENKTPEEIRAFVSTEFEKIYDCYRNTIMENKDNIFGTYVFGMSARTLYPTLEQVDSMSNLLKYAKDNTFVQKFRQQLVDQEKTKEGKMYTDFRGFSIDGKLLKLSDFVGKGNYVLVDFWASWCKPCMKEMPHLIKLHNTYKDKGLTVLGVNISDKHENFMKALKEQKIEYAQMEIPTYAKENGAKIYNVNSIPHIMLIAPDGTILKRGLHGEAMVKYVEETLNNNK